MIKLKQKMGRIALALALIMPAFGQLHAQWHIPAITGNIPNAATSLGGDCFLMTTGVNNLAVVWDSTQLDLSQAFDISLTVTMGPWGADGMTFALQNTGLNTWGAGANGLGPNNSQPPNATYPGISPLVAVELDVWDNTGDGVDDLFQDHLAIHTNGDILNATLGPVFADPGGADVTDSLCHVLRITWLPAPVNRMEVFFDGSLRMVWNNDMVNNYFGGNPNVYWGFTASCGSVPMTTTICANANFMEAGPDQTACAGDTVQLNASGSSTYSWNLAPPQLSDPNIADPTYTNGTAGTYQAIVSGVNGGGCTDQDTVLITLEALPVANAGTDQQICGGQVVGLGGPGTPGYAYVWTPGTGLNDPTIANPNASPLATTTYLLTVTDTAGQNGCSDTASVTVTVATADSIDIMMPDTFVCNGGSIDITGVFATQGVTDFSWSPTAGVSNPNDSSTTISPTTSTTYYLTGTNPGSGCSYTDSIRIDASNLLISYWTDSTICLGDSVFFDIQPQGGSGNYSYAWIDNSPDSLSDATIADPAYGPSAPGVYTFTVFVTDNVTGCIADHSITMTVTQLTVLATPPSSLINPGQRVQLQATGAVYYSWSPDTYLNCPTCPDPVSKPDESITYTVTGWDTSGCQGTASVTITVDSLLVPNVFSPNGDGINDILLLNYYGTGFYDISVYDRWGNQIFATTDKQVMWNGKTSSGADAPEGVYYLTVRIADNAIPDKDRNRVFAVTLIR